MLPRPWLGCPRLQLDQEAVAPLFDRLPEGIFRPLGVANSRHYWDVLSRVMSTLWGDDADPTSSVTIDAWQHSLEPVS